jgi:esterase/lipase
MLKQHGIWGKLDSVNYSAFIPFPIQMKYSGLDEFKFKGYVAITAFLLLLGSPFMAIADTVSVTLPSGLGAYANYREGRATQAAVIMLHGFQQTHHSEPMQSLGSSLASKGYTVLSPTLSLGVNSRSQSMACEAPHVQTIEDEVDEISYWMDWLRAKGHKKIIPIGFSSTGNLGVLLYTLKNSHLPLNKIILVGLNPQYQDAKDVQQVRSVLRDNSVSKARNLHMLTLGYCLNNLASTAHSYLSYVKYKDTKILELLSQTSARSELILGTADTILPANWLDQLKSVKPPVNITWLANANHFFEGTSEFDLADAVENILQRLNKP